MPRRAAESGMSPKLKRLLVWVAAVATMALTASAGVWQLGRAEQKQAAEAALERQRQMPAWTQDDWPCGRDTSAVSGRSGANGAQGDATAAAALPVQRPVMLRGHWLPANTVFLDNRPMGGVSGFIVVTPLRLSTTQGACPGGVVLVQRGWVSRDVQDRLRLPPIDTPEGEVLVPGRVSAALSQAYQLGDEPLADAASAPIVRQNADAAYWALRLGQAPLAGAVLQTRPAQPADAPVLRRQWPEPGRGQDKHLAYAAQWFAMAAVVAGLTIWFQLIRPRRQPRS
jgi:surfeit locus 1 family protein